MKRWPLLRFIVVGIGNTALGLGVIFSARTVVNDFAANLIGYLIVVPLSFLAHRAWSFRDEGPIVPAFLRYMPTIFAGYGINVLVLLSALRAGTNPYLAQSLALACHVVTTFVLSRIFVFLHPPENQ